MTLKTYRAKAKRTKITILLTYQDGFLKAFDIDAKEELSDGQKAFLEEYLPFCEDRIHTKIGKFGFTDGFDIEENWDRMTAKEKVAIFCIFYEKFVGVKYKTSQAEAGMIKSVEVSDKLLNTYFACNEWWAKVKSITFYCKNINEVRALAAGGKHRIETTGFPSYFDKEYENKLEYADKFLYWQHLRDNGFEAIKKNGKVTGWTNTKEYTD